VEGGVLQREGTFELGVGSKEQSSVCTVEPTPVVSSTYLSRGYDNEYLVPKS